MNPHRRRTVVIVSCLVATVALATIIIGCAMQPRLNRARQVAGPSTPLNQTGESQTDYANENKDTGGIAALANPLTDSSAGNGASPMAGAVGAGRGGGATDKDVRLDG